MKKHLSLILVLLPVLFLALPALAQERKKVGVVLSGGGAKGDGKFVEIYGIVISHCQFRKKIGQILSFYDAT